MQMSFASPRASRRPSLTPMIDVVFLLLVFFMLASRFGTDRVVEVTPPATGAAADWQGPPRLVTLRPDTLALNGVAIDPDRLAEALDQMMQDPSDPVLVRALDGADVQRLISVLDLLRSAGLTGAMVVE